MVDTLWVTWTWMAEEVVLALTMDGLEVAVRTKGALPLADKKRQ